MCSRRGFRVLTSRPILTMPRRWIGGRGRLGHGNGQLDTSLKNYMTRGAQLSCTYCSGFSRSMSHQGAVLLRSLLFPSISPPRTKSTARSLRLLAPWNQLWASRQASHEVHDPKIDTMNFPFLLRNWAVAAFAWARLSQTERGGHSSGLPRLQLPRV